MTIEELLLVAPPLTTPGVGGPAPDDHTPDGGAPGARAANGSESAPAPDVAPGEVDDAAPEKHLRVAPDTYIRRRRARLAVWTATLVTIASLFAMVAFHAMAVQQSFELDRLAEQRTAEARRYERLRRDVATLSSPAAIVEAATAQGMEFATETPQQLEVPEAAANAPADAQTADTLQHAHDETKSSLGP